MLGVDAPVSLLVLRELVVKSISPSSSAFPIYPLVRRVLRPALVEDSARPRGGCRFRSGPRNDLGRQRCTCAPTTARPRRPSFAAARRVLGGIALAMFAVIFFRLWYLQVLSGDQYLAEAKNNRIREIRVQAPRGEILDRNGERAGRQPDQPGAAGQPPRSCPPSATERKRELARARRPDGHSRCTGHPQRRCASRLKVAAGGAGDAASATSPTPRLLPAGEPGRASPGSRSQRVFVRHYPEGTLAAHIFGNVGEVSDES